MSRKTDIEEKWPREKRKEKSWELARLCRSFIQENSKKWTERKILEEEEKTEKEMKAKRFKKIKGREKLREKFSAKETDREMAADTRKRKPKLAN